MVAVAPAVGDEILAEHDEGARRDDAGQRLRDAHRADVGVDGAIEREVLGQRVDEHQRIVDVRADHCLLGARLREPETTVGRGRQLAREEALGQQVAQHGCVGLVRVCRES